MIMKRNIPALAVCATSPIGVGPWVYKERLREILERKQINVVRAVLAHWCTCVMRSKVQPVHLGPNVRFASGSGLGRRSQA